MLLQRLNEEAKRIVTNKKFFSGDLEEIPNGRIEQYIEPLEKDYELKELDDFLTKLMGNYEQYDVELDRELGPKIHQLLPLTRREAADPGLWHYLTVVFRPDFVRYRWEFNNYSFMKKRFLGSVNSWDSNTFSRLWWGAELTQNGEHRSYKTTKELFEKQTLARALLTRQYSWYKPLNSAFVAILKGEKETVYEEVAKRLNKTLATVKLETLDKDQLGFMIGKIKKEVKN